MEKKERGGSYEAENEESHVYYVYPSYVLV